MSEIISIVDLYWTWTGFGGSWKDNEISSIDLDPLCFPEFEKLRNVCISLINSPLSTEEKNAFLLCMALDSEDECILDACKERANTAFLCELLCTGISFSLSEARWQMAELLRKDLPGREQYLQMLLHDSDSYVRKRARNVAFDK